MKARIVWCTCFAVCLAALLLTASTRNFALCNVVVQLAIFVPFANAPAWRNNRLSYVDFAWPAGLAALGIQLALFAPAWPGLLVAGIYALMGLRMATWAAHMYRPGALTRDLPRYEYQRQRWERAGFRSERFSVQYEILVQAMANMTFLAMPALLVAADPRPSFTAWHAACAAAWLLAFAFESIADLQKRRFARSQAGRSKGVCDVGLWRHSRHPNYFGQWVQWIALAALALPSLLALRAGTHPMAFVVVALSLAWAVYLMYGTLVYYTGAIPSEHFSKRKRPDYAQYQATVNRFFPWGSTMSELLRAVGRWQILGLSINSVVGSGVYLLPATAFALLGPFSVWGVLAAGLTVSLLVLSYAKAASHFEQQGGSALYAREAFGPFAGFQIGWTTWLTRVATVASLSNGLADAVARFWPAAGSGTGRTAIIAGSLLLLGAINILGVRQAAQLSLRLVACKLLPLFLFVGIGVFHVDWQLAFSAPASGVGDLRNTSEAALLLLFAYAGFENLSVAAGEYQNPRRNVPFALVAMIVLVTALYATVQLVAQGTLPGLATSATPLADAAATFGGESLALLLTVGTALSILGTSNATLLLGPRFLHTLSVGGHGPRALARVHPRFRTPDVAIAVQTVVSLALALSGSFVQLALLSMVTRLLAYITTSASVLVLRRRQGDPPGTLKLPGGPSIPLAALLLSLALLLNARPAHLVAAGIAVLVGSVIYRFPRRAG